MRRAVVSVSSNIAEGCGRYGPAEVSRFLHVAISSSCEVVSQIELSRRLRFLDDRHAASLEPRRMLHVSPWKPKSDMVGDDGVLCLNSPPTTHHPQLQRGEPHQSIDLKEALSREAGLPRLVLLQSGPLNPCSSFLDPRAGTG